MSSYNLNDVLKARHSQNDERKEGQEIALDDISRVKVLSPGRRVFKRFIRNRLAVFGAVLLITMFVFSFIGPLLYPYGQKQIFYKYDEQHINYAMAKENTAYNGFDIDPAVTVERAVNNAMNSRIKSMIADGQDRMVTFGEENAYLIEKLVKDIYQVSRLETAQVATYGSMVAEIGTYSMVGKKMTFNGAAVEGLEAAVRAAIAANASGGEFEHNGVTYTYARGKAKSYTVTAALEGINYDGEPLGEAFEQAVEAATAAGGIFELDGAQYAMRKDGSAWRVYRMGASTPARVFSSLTVDTFTVGTEVSPELRLKAMLAAPAGGSFEAEGQTWSIEQEQDFWIIRDTEGKEYMELTPFSVRRYNGDNTMEYDLKKAISKKIEEMAAGNSKSGSLTYQLPMQQANGEYAYDENGELMFADTEMTITQRDTGEYVINCAQIIYVIDMYASPSAAHILGTDGDGFDVMARIMYGGRVSLMVGFVVVFLETFLGVIMGGLSGYYGGWVDMLIMRLVDIFYCLPSLPIMIILGAMMDAMRMDTYLRLIIMMAALGIMGWAGVARLVRGQILMLRDQEFMVATEATGIRVRDRILHHLVPNIMPQLIVQATMGMGGVILTESTLSFLGLGVKHPLATWGTIINSVSSASAMSHYAFIWIPVGLLICVTVIAFNFVGDGLRDAYDPKAKR